MTFGLEYFSSHNDFEEIIAVVDRYCNLARMELLNKLMYDIEITLADTTLTTAESFARAIYDLLNALEKNTTEDLVRGLETPTDIPTLKQILTKYA